MSFKKAQRKAAKFKGSIQGASGSGKTMTAIKVATGLIKLTAPSTRLALIDTEGDSAALYAPPFDFDSDSDFGEGTKKAYSVDALIKKMEVARTAKNEDGSATYGALIIDNMTHFWKEQGGMLSMIDDEVARMKANGKKADSFAAWKSIDPVYRKLMNYIRTYPLHVIFTLRTKQTYAKSETGGKIEKLGMDPEFREGFEYEVDAQFALDRDHTLVTLKHRLQDVLEDKVFKNAGDDLAGEIATWIASGAIGQDTSPVVEPVLPPAEVMEKMTPRAVSEALREEFLAAFKVHDSLEALRAYAANNVKPAVVSKRLMQEDYKLVSVGYLERENHLKAQAAQ